MEQRGLLQWFHLKYSGVLIFHVPNGGFRDINTARKLRAEGVVPGVPDLFIPAWHCFIEMKRVEGGKLSEEQVKIIEYLTRVGYTVIVGYGAEDASRKILEMRRGL